MKAKRAKVDQERKLLIGMITSTQYLREVQSIFDPHLLKLPYAKTVAQWCIEYYQQYDEAPQQKIQDIYSAHSRNGLTNAETIAEFLSSISREFESGGNVEYDLDQAVKYFQKRKLNNLAEDIHSKLITEDISGAEKLVGNFVSINRSVGKGVDVLRDMDQLEKAFENTEEGIFKLRGRLGDKLGSFQRGMLVGIMGPMKRGKTWWLQEHALQALKSGLSVAYFTLEMTEEQMLKRIFQCLCGLPKEDKTALKIPVLDCKLNQDGTCTSKRRKNNVELDEDWKFETAPEDYRPCKRCRKIEPTVWWVKKDLPGLTFEAARKQAKNILAQTGGSLRLKEYPTGEATVGIIKAQLDIWESYDNFTADVIVVDYADIMQMQAKQELRHNLNMIWSDLKGLATDRKVVVVTGTQSTRKTLEGEIKRGDVAEDIRKLAHVDIMCALNQNVKEEDKGIMRVSVLAHRHDETNSQRQITVLQSLATGNPYLDSF